MTYNLDEIENLLAAATSVQADAFVSEHLLIAALRNAAPKMVADLQEQDNQRIRISQILMSKRNVHASWDEIVEELKLLREESERYREALQKILAQATPCGYDYGNGEIARVARKALEVRGE